MASAAGMCAAESRELASRAGETFVDVRGERGKGRCGALIKSFAAATSGSAPPALREERFPADLE